MSILENLKNPVEKMILSSPLHGLLSADLAVITFDDRHTGKLLSFSVEYQREKRFIRVVCSRRENCWRKFTFGSPVEILIRGITYRGWAEIVDDKAEILREWKALFKRKPDIARKFGIEKLDAENFDLFETPQVLRDYLILRIEVSNPR